MPLETVDRTPPTPVEVAPPALRPARAEDDPARDALVLASPEGSLFQLSGWRRAVERVFGHQPRDWVAERDGALCGALPLMRCRRFPSGADLISTPYGVYGGPLAADAATRRALVEAAVHQGRSEGVGRVELRCRRDPGVDGLVASDLYVTFRKRMPDDPAQVVPDMKKDERRLVRRARDTHGLELCEGAWYAADLARLFHASKRRLGSPGLPLAWFRALQEELGERCVVHLARRGSEPLAASMCFLFRDELSMYYIGTEQHANREYATTSFMIAGLQEWAIERGLRVFDLGRSRRDAGAVGFKRNQGFEAEPLHYRYALVKRSAPPSFTPSNPRTAVLRRAWSRLPPGLCAWLSERLARRLP